MHSADLILRYLTRMRQRMRLVLFVNYACVALSGAALAVAAGSLAAGPTPVLEQIARLLVMGLLAVISAAALAVARTPTLRQTARLIDRALELRERLITALEVVADRDPMAVLLVTDAAEKVRGARPSHVFPLEIARGARALAVGSFIVVPLVWLLPATGSILDTLRLAPPARQSSPWAARTTSATAGQAAPDAVPIIGGIDHRARADASSADQPRAAVAPDRDAATAVAPQATSVLPPDPTVAAGLAALDRSPSPRDRSAPADAGAPEGEPGAARREPERASDLVSPPRLDEQRPAQGSASRAIPRLGDQPGGSEAAASRAAARERADAAKHTQAAGPSAPGAIDRPNERARAIRSDLAAIYATSWRRAEEVLAQERIPIGFRQYIRDYFVAIRP